MHALGERANSTEKGPSRGSNQELSCCEAAVLTTTSSEYEFIHLQCKVILLSVISNPRRPTRQPNASLVERQVVLSGPSAGHTLDTEEVKSSRPPTDHSTLGPCLRHHVNFLMRVSSS